MQKEPEYNTKAVDSAIRNSRKPIGKKESKLIHALLRGRDKPKENPPTR
jgi:hypothetical protein